MKSVSIVIPVKEERETIVPLVQAIDSVFQSTLGGSAHLNEVIFVDDGSRDQTWAAIEKVIEEYPFVLGVRLRRNFGKAIALQEGIQLSTGEIVITMDGDLQDDPNEIPRFLDALEEGFDLVSGWKIVRHDPLGKTLPSKIFNKVTALVTGVKIHDFNCGFKAYRRNIFDSVRIYGELHRFIPTIAHSMGFRVGEITVNHHPRRFGQSKYGLNRLLKGFLDLLTVVTITKYSYRPGHLFGGLGVAVGAMGGLMLLYLTAVWFHGQAIGGRPLLIISALLLIVGVQFVLFGMIAELLVSLNRDGPSNSAVIVEIRRHVLPAVRKKRKQSATDKSN
ncbi:glycosyltransferase family 2 protein [Mesorhizobium sp. B2-1-3A]|uniref:glycosyltransferase family 2 protein n=1 Tax=Mesorhizobium sp. B2-1-3A TaxID=2589971 RepID=UPI00112EBB04|nr:glycosyltransferase family 2 protein [Mesorhizobium sp. B2-1-3A]TPN01698.1 glycosyltransferase family 2 protein [Mesorhizobium sp. B2-1-3A]